MVRQFISDIRDHDRENRRQHQALHGATETTIWSTVGRLQEGEKVTAVVPVKGAVSATASVLTVIMVEIPAALAPNSSDSSGKIDCGE